MGLSMKKIMQLAKQAQSESVDGKLDVSNVFNLVCNEMNVNPEDIPNKEETIEKIEKHVKKQ